MGNKKNRFGLLLFYFSLITLSFLYGYLVNLTHIFPYQIIESAGKAAFSLFYKMSSDRLPWYYRKGEYPQNKLISFKAKSAYKGLNLITSVGIESKLFAQIISMQGQILHEWNIDWFKLWPKPSHLPDEIIPKEKPGTHIDGAILMPNGDIVFNFQYCGLIRLNPCGGIVWRLPYQTHHSINFDEQGHLWVSGRKHHKKSSPKYKNYKPPFEEETILEVSSDGKILQEISVMDLFIKNDLRGFLYMGPQSDWSTKTSGDTIHLNDVEPFPANLKEGFFSKEDIMVSLRNVNTVFVFNRFNKRIKFLKNGYFVRQHDPDFIDGNTISVFDNNHIAPESNGHQSRILILSARESESQVYFSGSKIIPFYTVILGKHQWLPNGNLLITESMKGRAFEIDQKGEIVWEYLNIVENGVVGIVEEAQRVPLEFSTIIKNRMRECGGNNA